MVVNIGKDCWDIINGFKNDLEHKDKFKKTLDIIKNFKIGYCKGKYGNFVKQYSNIEEDYIYEFNLLLERKLLFNKILKQCDRISNAYDIRYYYLNSH